MTQTTIEGLLSCLSKLFTSALNNRITFFWNVLILLGRNKQVLEQVTPPWTMFLF